MSDLVHEDGPLGILAALQLADSFFPSGAYAYSQGLEGMVRRGWVRGAADVEELLRNQLTWSVLPADGVALLNARRAGAEGDLETVVAIDRSLFALKLPAELRVASVHTGRRYLTETVPLTNDPNMAAFRERVVRGETPGTGAAALGVIATALNISGTTALLAFSHSFATGVLGAAVRLLPITHSQVQGILFHLHSLIADLSAEIADRPWQEMTSFTPELDLAAMGHETEDVRMFAS